MVRSAREMSVETSSQNGTAIISVRGPAGSREAPTLRAALDSALQGEAGFVVVDLTRVWSMDSTGVGVLASALRKVREKGGELVLVGPRQRLIRLIREPRLDELFRVFDDYEAARRARPRFRLTR